MLTRILAIIATIWGGGVILSGLLGSGPEGGGAYVQGQGIGLLFGAVLFGVGVFYLIKGGKKTTSRK